MSYGMIRDTFCIKISLSDLRKQLNVKRKKIFWKSYALNLEVVVLNDKVIYAFSFRQKLILIFSDIDLDEREHIS